MVRRQRDCARCPRRTRATAGVSYATVFFLIFGGLFILRLVLVTVFIASVLPHGNRCPSCDAQTIRLQAVPIGRWFPRFRRSWCLTCGWQGVLRSNRPLEATVPEDALPRARRVD